MNQQKSSSLESGSGVASGSRENMTGPDDGRSSENALHNIELETRGEFLEDHQRDRDSKGVKDGYDDSVERRKGGEHDYLGVTRGD